MIFINDDNEYLFLIKIQNRLEKKELLLNSIFIIANLLFIYTL